jgi:hypothetical protein
MPAAITAIKVDFNDNLHFGCLNRLLTFKLKPLFKEQDLPNYWQNSEIRKIINQMGKSNADSQQQSPKEARQISTPGIALSELKKLIAHGVLLPDSIHDIAAQYKEVDVKQLLQNLKKFHVTTQQVLKLIANSRFAPKDILLALATKTSPQIIYSLINQGASITAYMTKMGFKMLRLDEDPLVNIDMRSLLHPSSVVQHKGLATDFNYAKWWLKYFPLESESEEEYDEELEDEDFFDFPTGRQYVQPKGKVVHFIPSEQIKLLKDLQSKRDVKPIFLRSLASGQVEGEKYPNFTGEEEYDEILSRSRRPHPAKTDRFNETLKGQLIRTTQKIPVRSKGNRVAASLQRNSLHASSQVFKPEKYIQTRGLNISFEPPPPVIEKKAERETIDIKEFTETLLSTPIVVGQTKVLTIY